MNNLTYEEQNELRNLRNKIAHGTASSLDMKRFLELILKSSPDNQIEIENHIKLMGYSSIDDFKKDLDKKGNDELINSLIIIGGAVLMGYLLKDLFKK